MKFDLENPLTSSKEHENDTVSALFAAESDHMPSFFSFKSTDIPFFIRRHAFSLISQVNTVQNLFLWIILFPIYLFICN